MHKMSNKSLLLVAEVHEEYRGEGEEDDHDRPRPRDRVLHGLPFFSNFSRVFRLRVSDAYSDIVRTAKTCLC